MLTDLMVESLGVIDRAELRLTPGSSALTGETGAGKTLLVAALGLLLGGRADRSIVRDGAAQAIVDARFVVEATHPAAEILMEQDLLVPPSEEGECEIVLSRSVSADGGSKARINGRLVTASLLQEIGRCLIEIAGQHEQHGLGSPGAQREVLDSYAGAEELVHRVATRVAEMARLAQELEEVRSGERDRQREVVVLAHEIKEIEELALIPGEVADLEENSSRLEHSEAIAAAISSATAHLKGDAGAGEALAAALSDVEVLVEYDPAAAELLERLRASAIEVADVADELGRRTVTTDPATLTAARDRLAEITRVLKRYGPSEPALFDHLERSKDRLAQLQDPGLREEQLEAAIAAARADAEGAARELSRVRKESAARLVEAMDSALGDLAMQGARFDIQLEPVELHACGLETVSFLVSANVGESSKPLSKVASGGELSRIALALRLETGGGTAPTLVFDEVDAGVGGEAARSVGRYLAALGEKPATQVLVVTHLPQVAAAADHQYRVSKVVAGDRTSSLVQKIDGDARIEELSRMLAGLPDSERGREHAQELLDLATKEAGR